MGLIESGEVQGYNCVGIYYIKTTKDYDKAEVYFKKGINAGANAGKILGAGGGGFIMYLVDPAKKKNLIKNMNKFIHLPIKFENSGTEIIYKDNNI